MDEKQQEPLLNDKLRLLVNKPAEKLLLMDIEGKEHGLSPLTLNDLLEFEDRLGVSLFQAAATKLSLRHITVMLWLAVRKHGLTREQITKRQYRMTLEEFGEMFDITFLLGDTLPVVGKLLELSGIGQKNPPKLAKSEIERADKSAGMPSSDAKPL